MTKSGRLRFVQLYDRIGWITGNASCCKHIYLHVDISAVPCDFFGQSTPTNACVRCVTVLKTF